VVPDLVVLEEYCCNLVHEQQLEIKRRVYSDEGLVPVLPTPRSDLDTLTASEVNAHHAE
jgi:hypothetical protein